MDSVQELVRCELDDMDVLVFELELPPPPLPELSEGESEVAILVGEGLSNAAIARARGVSGRTVASQLRSIFRKLDLSSRWALSLLLTRRVVAAASSANVNPSTEGEARYEPALTSRARTVMRAAVVSGRLPRIDSVAAALDVSPRTLQRQLHAEGESFRAILTATRIAEARRRLERGDEPARVAEALGYTSAASLRRALRGR